MTPEEHERQRDRVRASMNLEVANHDVYPSSRRPHIYPGLPIALAVLAAHEFRTRNAKEQ